MRKCTKHLLTLWGTQPGNTRIGFMKMMLRCYHCLRKGVGHMMHFCPNRQETEHCATRKQNLNCKKLRAIQNAWWDKKADELQQLADGNSSKGFFAAIKQVYGPHKTAVAPISDAEGSHMLTEKPAIVSRWREYFSDLLNCPATAREEALASLDQYPVQEDMANPPTLEEILAAIKSMKSGKTPGLDGIPAEIYKYGGTALHAQLLKFYHICWTAKELPQQFKDTLIIAIYQKG